MGHPIAWYLPDEIFILLSTLGYALMIRILGVENKQCTTNDSGLICWLFLVAMFVLVAVSKYLDTKNIGLSVVGGLIAFFLGLGLHEVPLKCVIHPKGRLNWIMIIQSVFVGVPLLLYLLVLIMKRRA